MPPNDPATFADAHQKLLGDGSIQFSMVKPTAPEIPFWLRWLGEVLTSPVAKYVFWAFLAIVVILLLLLIAHQFDKLGRRRGNSPEGDAGDDQTWQPDAGTARALLSEADALAGQGRYDEAARLLLFRSIEHIEERRPRLIRPALTSRDIAGAPELPAAPRQAFARIAMMVERSLFGGRSLIDADWRECRESYEQFALAGAWQ